MLVLGIHTGHDGAITAVKDREVLFCLESEKDSFVRHSKLTPMSILDAIDRLGEMPDAIAVAGAYKEGAWYQGRNYDIGAGYFGADVVERGEFSLFGKRIPIVETSHIRSHIIGAAGMAPEDHADQRAVLIWEGAEGSFFVLDERWRIVREFPVLKFPGGRYAFLFGIAEPRIADHQVQVDGDFAGKLMALAAYADPADASPEVVEAVERLLEPVAYGKPKGAWKDAPFYNVGVEADVTKSAAALIQQRMFEIYADVAQRELPRGIPLYIAGGCGLNCDWNTMWRESGQFSSVFVPPCANDSGSALGAALNALLTLEGDPRVEWDVYCGDEFIWDIDPDPGAWHRRPLEEAALADALVSGRVVAWVQGRWELGPRALGNRSLLADPFEPGTRDKLNVIKQREGYRPIAPVARLEDAGKVFDRDFHDPYMLHFRMVTTPNLGAITHVDGSARAQTVTKNSNPALHGLLSTFAERHGVGVLCNTSLNFKGHGFINHMSDLARYCELRELDAMVVGDAWFERIR